MQHRNDANLGAKMFAIGADGGQCLRGGFEQQSIDRRLVLVGHGGDHARKLEHEMKIWNGEKLGFPRFKPVCGRFPQAFAAMSVAATVIRHANVRTVLAALNMSAECSGATNLNRGHHTSLGDIDMVGIGSAPRLTMAAKDIRHL